MSLPGNRTACVTPAGDVEEAGYLKPDHFNAETIEALEDVLAGRNLRGPYNTAKEAVAAMLED